MESYGFTFTTTLAVHKSWLCRFTARLKGHSRLPMLPTLLITPLTP
jgi:hypothetical protein